MTLNPKALQLGGGVCCERRPGVVTTGCRLAHLEVHGTQGLYRGYIGVLV